VIDDIFGGAGAPVAQNALKQLAATLEVVVEAPSGYFEILCHIIDPYSVDTAFNQRSLCRVNPILFGQVGA
jgi:hypothetical protein